MIHGDPALTRHGFGRVYQQIDGRSVEVFPTPFERETRALANECFDRFARMHNGKDLHWDMPHNDREAANMIRSGFPIAIKDAERAGNLALAQHFRDLTEEVPRQETFQWLWWLACDGCGRRPAAAVLEEQTS